MSLEYIRDHYKVPAYIDMRVKFTGYSYPRYGVITGAKENQIVVRMDDNECDLKYHPTWKMQYLTGGRASKPYQENLTPAEITALLASHDIKFRVINERIYAIDLYILKRSEVGFNLVDISDYTRSQLKDWIGY